MRCFVVALFLLAFRVAAIKWLGINRIPVDTIRAPNDCPKSREYRKLLGLTTIHTKICRRAVELIPLIIEASRDTIDTCQTAFAGHRWNCSSLSGVPALQGDLTKGTKEQAFIYALAAASLMHHVAKACASGELPDCPCGFGDTSAQTTVSPDATSVSATREATSTYKWRGCSDNVVHGKRVSREWTEISPPRKASYYKVEVDPEMALNFSENEAATKRKRSQRFSLKRRYLLNTDVTGDDIQRYFTDEGLSKNFHVDSIVGPKSKMNQHNSDVGRHIAEQSLFRKCKCHGVSNSCDIKTCWYTLPPLQSIAKRLKEHYVRARMIRQSENNIRVDIRALRTTGAKQSLVYLRPSADYCEKNESLGSYGTRMRECNLTSTGPDSCESLCCGRGFNTQQVRVEEQCECKYVHCCYVKCKTCIYDIDKYFCK